MKKRRIVKVITAFLTLAVIIKISPLSNVFAEPRYIELDFTDGTINGNVITYTVGNVDVTATLDNNYTLTNGKVSIEEGAWLTAITIDDNYDSNTMQIRVYETGVQNPFQTTYSYSAGTLTRNGEGGLPDNLKFVIEPKGSSPNPPEPGEGFDGRAVVLWSCGSGDTGVCFHEFSVVDPQNCDPEHPTTACDPEIGDFDDGNSTFFRDTEVTADNKQNAHFNVYAEYKEWYLTDEFYKWQELYRLANGMEQNAEINWDTVDPRLIMGEPNQNIGQLEEAVTAANYCENLEPMEDCVNRYAATENHEIWTHELQPVGEPDEINAYVSFGDRNFKVVIYNEEYKGVSTTADFSDLHYYPASWADAFTRIDQYDVSATDEDHPTALNSILLESTVNLDILPYNGYEVASIEALDVPEDAVNIQEVAKQNPEDNQQFKIIFTSNFYDHVVFKLTDTNGGESYVQIMRATIDGWIRDGDTLSADFYFDRTKSYTDFILTAKVLYYDGTIENVTLEAVDHFRDSLGNPIDAYEADQEESAGPFQGKGLKQSVFEYRLGENADRNVKDIYLNAEYTGNDPSVYPGAYSGSGEGTPANLFHPDEGGH